MVLPSLPNSEAASTGQLKASDTWGQYNNYAFVVRQLMAKMQTATLVKIVSCTNSGGLSPFGFVDVQPLVNQIDGSSPPNSTPHTTIYGLPYQRMQGGSNAIIMDPEPGDIGLAVFASRDISVVKNTQGQAKPGSLRAFDFADGMYVGGMLNAAPLQYVQFAPTGITIVSPTAITLQAPVINVEGNLSITGGDATMSGTLITTGDITSNGISLQNHLHTSEAAGTPTSPPLP
jgi:hypothetical protein